MIGRRFAKAAADDHTVSIAGAAVTDRAVDIEPLTTSHEQRSAQLCGLSLLERLIELVGNQVVQCAVGSLGNLTHKIARFLARVERLVLMEFASRDCPFDARAPGEPVG